MKNQEKEIVNIVTAFILKIIDLYSWTSICTVRQNTLSAALFERGCGKDRRDSYQISFYVCF